MPVKLDVMARISDTTGALMAGNYADKKCRIGVILGIKLILTFNAQLAFFFHNIVILADRFFLEVQISLLMCILGTGSNAAFVERIENYNKFEGKDPDTKQVCNQNLKKRVDQSLFLPCSTHW